MTTGEMIKELRIKKGLSQEQLGKLVGVQRAAINKYEKGLVVNLKRKTIAKLAAALDVTPTQLMGWDEVTAADATISSNIKKYREAAGVSQQQLADFVGVPIARVISWERGERFPSVGQFEEICKALAVPADYLRSIPENIGFKNHEDDYLFDVFSNAGFSIFNFASGDEKFIVIGCSNKIYRLSVEEFEHFKGSIRDFIKYKIHDTLKDRKPMLEIDSNLDK